MQIVMLTDDYLPRIGGVAAHIYHLSKALLKIGCRVEVLHIVSDGRGMRRRLVREEAGNMPVYRLQRGKYRANWMRHIDILWALMSIKKHLGSVTLVHQHDYLYSSRAAHWFSRLTGCKWVWTNHTSMFLLSVSLGSFSKRAQSIHNKMHGCIAVSREILDVSRTVWNASKIAMEYIPNGVDIDMFSPNDEWTERSRKLGSGPFVVLCPRRIAEKNGVIYFAEAAGILHCQHPDVDWRFWITGHMYQHSEYAERILQALNKPMMAGQVAFLGAVPHHQMPEVYRRSDVVVIPSLVEAVSLSALEAMACGVPVIATSVGGLPEVVRDEFTGLLVPPQNAEAIASAIWKLHTDRNLSQRVAENAYAMVQQRYTWDRIAQETVNFYRRLTGIPQDA